MRPIEANPLPPVKIDPIYLKVSTNLSLRETLLHVETVNHGFTFIESHHKASGDQAIAKVGAIAYEAISEILKKEQAYFNKKAADASLCLQEKIIVEQSNQLLKEFTFGFESLTTLINSMEKNILTKEFYNEPFNAMVVNFLPIIYSNLISISFLHTIFIKTLFLFDEKDHNELLIMEEKISHIVDYFGTMSHAIMDLEDPLVAKTFNEENKETYLLDFYLQLEHFEEIFQLTANHISKSPLLKDSFAKHIERLSAHIAQFRISAERMIKERAERGEVSAATLNQTSLNYQNFFREIQVPHLEI